MRSILDWLDHRTGYRGFVHEALYERIPGGARWRYVWGSTLVFAFFVQLVTGIFLWMSYSPSSQSAWESVYYIQHEIQWGWLLRGVHHFMAQAMIVLMVIHLMQVIIDGAYRAPREINFWLGLVLMLIVLALGLTGYLLPWDQKGYAATGVATEIAAQTPVVGAQVQRLMVGGPSYGNLTLTRFFALHAGILPGLLIAFLVLHVALFRRHGITVKDPRRRADTTFWPDQVLKDAVACLAVLVAVLFLCALPALNGHGSFSDPGSLGAELSAPADISVEYGAPRPEWYFLFLFQFLKLFKGMGELGVVFGAMLVPGLVMLVLFLMPFIGRWKLGHRFNIGFTFILLAAISWLTYAAWSDDHFSRSTDPNELAAVAQHSKIFNEVFQGDEARMLRYFDLDKDKMQSFLDKRHVFEKHQESLKYFRSVDEASTEAHRITQLIDKFKIPPTGALSLLQQDPMTQGPRLFKEFKCADCHDYRGPPGSSGPQFSVNRIQVPQVSIDDKPGAKAVVKRNEKTGQILWEPNGGPNLYAFASREWITGLLNPQKFSELQTVDLIGQKTPDSPDPEDHRREVTAAPYFGNTAHRFGSMSEYLRDPDAFGQLTHDDINKIVVALSAQAALPAQRELDKQARAAGTIAAGEKLIANDSNCAQCHHFGDSEYEPDGVPDLAGYGSRQWLIEFISDPAHARFYGEENDRMPEFAKYPKDPKANLMTREQIEMLADWLRGDDPLHREAQP